MLLLGYLSAGHLMAGPLTWNNGAGNFLWDGSSANWSGSAWGSGNDAVFGGAQTKS
jgi:hypothetical protein